MPNFRCSIFYVHIQFFHLLPVYYNYSTLYFLSGTELLFNGIFRPIEDGRSGTFMIGNQSFPASLLDLPAVVESYKTYDDSFLVKTADIGQMVMVREEDDPAPEGVEYKHGLTPPMRDARRRRYRREPDLSAELVHRVEKDLISIMQGTSVNQNASAVGAGEGSDRKKAAPTPAPKPVQEPAANGEEAEPERSDSDESDN